MHLYITDDFGDTVFIGGRLLFEHFRSLSAYGGAAGKLSHCVTV